MSLESNIHVIKAVSSERDTAGAIQGGGGGGGGDCTGLRESHA